jgi:hypothetical protein
MSWLGVEAAGRQSGKRLLWGRARAWSMQPRCVPFICVLHMLNVLLLWAYVLLCAGGALHGHN